MSTLVTPFTKLFNLRGPIVIAPMGGGPTTPELVAATCNVGALGSVAGAYLSPDQIDETVTRVRTLTQRPFAINLFTPMPKVKPSQDEINKAIEGAREFRLELDIPDPSLQAPYHPDFEKQFVSVLKALPKVFSFVFGLLEKHYIKECSDSGIYTIGTATTLDEAQALQESGVNAVIVQGVEAGAHRGIFSPNADDPGIGTLELTQLTSSKLRIPVIAAGGIMTGEEIARVLKAGAQAAMLGTAFLLCPEAGTSEPYRSALAKPGNKKTRLTRAFSGRLARGIENRFMQKMDADPSKILPFPVQNAFTRDIRNQAMKKEKSDFLSLWAGTGLAKIRQMPAGDLVKTLFVEIENS